MAFATIRDEVSATASGRLIAIDTRKPTITVCSVASV